MQGSKPSPADPLPSDGWWCQPPTLPSVAWCLATSLLPLLLVGGAKHRQCLSNHRPRWFSLWARCAMQAWNARHLEWLIHCKHARVFPHGEPKQANRTKGHLAGYCARQICGAMIPLHRAPCQLGWCRWNWLSTNRAQISWLHLHWRFRKTSPGSTTRSEERTWPCDFFLVGDQHVWEMSPDVGHLNAEVLEASATAKRSHVQVLRQW